MNNRGQTTITLYRLLLSIVKFNRGLSPINNSLVFSIADNIKSREKACYRPRATIEIYFLIPPKKGEQVQNRFLEFADYCYISIIFVAKYSRLFSTPVLVS